MHDLEIRLATQADLPAIVDIYNQSIPGGWSTADTVPVTVESRRSWFAKFDPNRRPIWVAVDAGTVVGWVALSWFYEGRPAYNATAEISTYIATSHQRRGLGRRLKLFAMSQCPRLGITTVVSVAFDHNTATRKLNAELGYEEVGHLQEIAIVDGVPRGAVYAIKRIPPSGEAATAS